ncbi:squalene/phytoene synthase family protein [Microbispora sp. RL4-1S]|uniref:Squalene/phytoene synthase family protein n=1 Tax=Microbispora oryzae TaxID=2806554 RepID=A0A940WEF8_9ACTN|nr:squalene/phytoene synthase family protein [Microbispora oryzae]MBP2704030.1 squalene/phytoene synthase family protein [Microbispora oryzae]
MNVSEAYRHCEWVVRVRARNFAYGIRLLPPPKRRALSAVYAFARRIDDIGDGAGSAEERLAALARARARLHETPPRTGDPVLVALHDAAARYPIPLAAFDELIDGCTADVAGATYECFDDLLAYCRNVAGSIGRLSLGVFGCAASQGGPHGPGRMRGTHGLNGLSTMNRPDGLNGLHGLDGLNGLDGAGHGRPDRLADSLGVALQLTNILRDLVEDRAAGRIYLPAEDLRRFGCTLGLDARGRFTDPPERLTRLVRFEAGRTLDWYAEGMCLVGMLDRRSAACTAAMAGIYRRLLARIAADPLGALSGRASLAPWVKAVAAACAVAGAGR